MIYYLTVNTERIVRIGSSVARGQFTRGSRDESPLSDEGRRPARARAITAKFAATACRAPPTDPKSSSPFAASPHPSPPKIIPLVPLITETPTGSRPGAVVCDGVLPPPLCVLFPPQERQPTHKAPTPAPRRAPGPTSLQAAVPLGPLPPWRTRLDCTRIARLLGALPHLAALPLQTARALLLPLGAHPLPCAIVTSPCNQPPSLSFPLSKSPSFLFSIHSPRRNCNIQALAHLGPAPSAAPNATVTIFCLGLSWRKSPVRLSQVFSTLFPVRHGARPSERAMH